MSYRKIPEIPRAERTYWSPERGGRIWQTVGGKRVKKFSYSPFTAKPREVYTFYADIEMEKEVEYEAKEPSKIGRKFKRFTTPVFTGTYLEFRDAVEAGEIQEKCVALAESYGGGFLSASYWRNRGVRGED